MKKMKTAVGCSALAMAVLGLGPALATAQSSETEEITLGLGNVRFWEEEGVDHAAVPGPDACDVAGPCWEYPIRVNTDEGARMRIALTAVFRDPEHVRPLADPLAVAPEMMFDIQVLRPDGNEVVEPTCRVDGDEVGVEGDEVGVEGDEVVVEGDEVVASTCRLNGYSMEVFVDPPAGSEHIAKGDYLVRVIPVSVTNMAFRMRAALEGDETVAPDPALLSPNLRIIPPFEIGFHTPTVTYGAGVPDTDPHASCMAEEIPEALAASLPAPQICLRYSMGIENAGPGAFGILFGVCDPEPSGEYAHRCPAQQRLYRANPAEFQDEPAGSAGYGSFHFSHAHWHYRNIYEFELFSVPDDWREGGRAPDLEKAGEGRKLGSNPGNELLADWDRVYQGDQSFWPNRHGVHIGLNTGWGDIYEYNRGGNYVDFTDRDDGFYVLRGTTDPLGVIIETDKTDNVAYAFIHIEDYNVDLIERGLGTDPWDPNKTVYGSVPA